MESEGKHKPREETQMADTTWAPTPDDPERMTVEEVCELVGRSSATVYRWMKDGMPSYKWGGERVFRRSEVLGWINQEGT